MLRRHSIREYGNAGLDQEQLHLHVANWQRKLRNLAPKDNSAARADREYGILGHAQFHPAC